MSTAQAEAMLGTRHPRDLVSFFANALKSFQASKDTFRVLRTLPATSLSGSGAPLAQTPRCLLVLDSSFNPPTLAHRRMAVSALGDSRSSRATDGPTRMLLLLAVNNADKAPKPAVFPQRLAMMYLLADDLLAAAAGKASSEAPACEAVDIAVTTEPYFHSKSVVIEAAESYSGGPEQAPGRMEQVYLTGFDTLIRIFNPKYYPDNTMTAALGPFFARSRLRVTMRTDADWGDAAAQVAYLESLKQGKLVEVGGQAEWADKVDMVDGRQADEEAISSTKVRDAVVNADWEALRKLVPDDVAAWIKQEKLYSIESTL